MPLSLGVLYSNVLSLGEVGDVLQRRIFNYASRCNDVQLLLLLAAHPGVSAETDALVGQVSNARVRAAWLRNPNRDAAQAAAAIASEKRVSVLGAVAELDEELPDAVWETLVDRAESAESSTLALKVAANGRAPRVSRARAASVYARCASGIGAKDLARFAGAVPFAEQMASVVRSYDVAAHLVGVPNLSSASVERLVDVVIGWLSDGNGDGTRAPWHVDHGFRRLAALLDHPAVSVVAAQKVLTFAGSEVGLSLRSSSLRRASSSLANLAAAAQAVVDAGGGRGQAAVSPESVSDPAEIDALIASSAWSSVFAAALATNPHLSLVQFDRLLDASRYNWRMMQSIAGLVVGFPDRFACLLRRFPYLFDDDMVAAAPDPVALLEAVGHVAVSVGSPLLLSAVVSSRFFKPEMVLGFPVSFVMSTALPAEVAAGVLSALEVVVSDDGAWEAFEGLAPEFGGTFSGLLETASKLS